MKVMKWAFAVLCEANHLSYTVRLMTVLWVMEPAVALIVTWEVPAGWMERRRCCR
jgi:hypothetical protein